MTDREWKRNTEKKEQRKSEKRDEEGETKRGPPVPMMSLQL